MITKKKILLLSFICCFLIGYVFAGNDNNSNNENSNGNNSNNENSNSNNSASDNSNSNNSNSENSNSGNSGSDTESSNSESGNNDSEVADNNKILLTSTGVANGAKRTIETLVNKTPGTSIDLIPFSVDDSIVLTVGNTYTVKYGGGAGTNGWYRCLSLGGNGASIYRANLQYGYSGTLAIGNSVTAENGNMSGPTNQGVSYRISGRESETWDNYQEGSPRVVVIPSVQITTSENENTSSQENSNSNNSSEESNSDNLIVTKLGVYFLDAVGGNGNDCYVTCHYLGDSSEFEVTPVTEYNLKNKIEVNN